MEVPVTEAEPGKGRKRKKCPEKWKANLAKKERYSSHGLPEQITCNHHTKKFQCKHLKVRNLLNFHNTFYARSTKQHQDAIILKCCTPKKIIRRRPTKGVRTGRECSIKYAIYADKKLVLVCQKVFLNTLGIKKYRVQFVMQNFFRTGQLPKEKRGGDHKKKKYQTLRQSIHNFIKSLINFETHYCRSDVQQRKYLSSELNIKKLYRIFKEKNPETSAKLSYFRAVFNEDFNLGFGSPRTDVCSTCIALNEKIKSEVDGGKKAKLMIDKRLHSLKYHAFYKLLKEKKDQMTTFSFDCQKNLALPKVPDQSCYYSRQLYLYNFTIVQGSSKDPLNVNTTFAYIWTENEFAKSANQIASAVYDRLNKTNFTGISHIRLVADGCSGQNKNSTMLAMCCRWLLDNRHIKKIELVFPITGHSFKPPDRVFGNIEKKIRKKEVIVKPEEYIDFISEHATVTSLSNILVYDWKTSVQNTVKAPAQLHFKITQCKRFILRRSKKMDNVLVRGELFYNSDTGNPKSICKAGKNAEIIKPTLISKGLAVNKLKLKDVKDLLKKHYGEDWNVRPELEFYEKVISSPECEEEETEDTELCEMRDLDIGLRV